jgi:hypothetical protein
LLRCIFVPFLFSRFFSLRSSLFVRSENVVETKEDFHVGRHSARRFGANLKEKKTEEEQRRRRTRNRKKERKEEEEGE